MELVTKKLSEIYPYPGNPRVNDGAVEAVMESIRQCTPVNPIIVDEDGVILAGHTRLKALKRLGYKEVQVCVKTGLTDEQKRKYRLLDNKTAELSDWDYDLLAGELEGLDFGDLDIDWGFDEEDEGEEQDDKYTAKIDIPQYEPDPDSNVTVKDLVDSEKAKRLIEQIEQAEIPEEVKEFLRLAAYRHLKFNYKNVADFYAKAPEEVQELMELSALVIIDYEDAIKNGYSKLRAQIEECV